MATEARSLFYTQCCKCPAEWTDNYCGDCGRALKPPSTIKVPVVGAVRNGD